MGAFIPDQRLPISDGFIVNSLRGGLISAGWSSGLFGGTELPATKTRRMFTVRDDSGPLVGRVQARRQGINVWADSSVDALNMALDAMRICQRDLPNGEIVVSTSGFSGPFKIPVETPVVVGNKNLTNYYFTFVAGVKASAS